MIDNNKKPGNKGLNKGLGKGLGKGLATLIQEASVDIESTVRNEMDKYASLLKNISIDLITPNRFQPRIEFSEEEIESLSESIKKNGVLQPIILRKIDENYYEIIAGERRYRASKLANLNTIPAIIKNDISDADSLEIAIVENLERQNLNGIEEAKAYQLLITNFGYTQEKVAQELNRSRSYVTNMLRLLKLPESVQNMVFHDEISIGHAKILVGVDNAQEIAEDVIIKKLSVRDLEKFLRKKPNSKTIEKHIHNLEDFAQKNPVNTKTTHDANDLNNENLDKKGTSTKRKNADIISLEKEITDELGLNISIDMENSSSGNVTIEFRSLSDLDFILQKLGD